MQAPIHNRLRVILPATPSGEKKAEPDAARRLPTMSSGTDAGLSRRSAGQERAQTMIPNTDRAEGDDIFGDGVNVAARLEALAEPGGVFISNTVHDHVRDRLPFDLEDLGEHQVKNIARPVRVYRVHDRDIPRGEPPSALPQPLPLPDKPSIAVLPFANMSGDPEQEYFADGMVGDHLPKPRPEQFCGFYKPSEVPSGLTDGLFWTRRQPASTTLLCLCRGLPLCGTRMPPSLLAFGNSHPRGPEQIMRLVSGSGAAIVAVMATIMPAMSGGCACALSRAAVERVPVVGAN